MSGPGAKAPAAPAAGRDYLEYEIHGDTPRREWRSRRSSERRDLAVLVEEIQSVRYCPLQEVDARVMRLALRLANAEGLLWELRQGACK